MPGESGNTELRVIPLITSKSESIANLRRLIHLGELTLPAVIDDPEKSINHGYSGYPNRLYVIDPGGRVVFKGAPGPTGLKVPDLAAWLRENVK